MTQLRAGIKTRKRTGHSQNDKSDWQQLHKWSSGLDYERLDYSVIMMSHQRLKAAIWCIQ